MRPGPRKTAALTIALFLIFFQPASAQNQFAEPPVPLDLLGTGTYLSFHGGLYPEGSNRIPARHAAEGRHRASLVQPLDPAGRPDPSGKIVLLSIGMSNTSQEFCNESTRNPVCFPWSFVGQAEADPAVNHRSLALVNGAVPGRGARHWIDADDPAYRFVAQTLSSRGLSPEQVQVIWLKQAHIRPRQSLPGADADAYRLVESLGSVVRTLKDQFPNLQMVFLSSRIYAGYAITETNPEPYAYETGFSVKWLIEAQIEQMARGSVSERAGDLDYRFRAPWLAWGPYLWADGEQANPSGLAWLPEDFSSDGTHPSRSGETKVAGSLLAFFKTSPYTQPWFLGRSAEIPTREETACRPEWQHCPF